MFKRTRLTLTAWYLLIVMVISIAFSMIIYRGINFELTRFAARQTARVERELGIFSLPRVSNEILVESRVRVIRLLVGINALILVIAGAGGYYLAGKTLAPIEEMLSAQQDFITNASHDLKTPITALRTNLEVSLRNRDLTTSQLRKILNESLIDAIKLQNLTENLLTLSTNERTPHTKVQLAKIISSATAEVRPLAIAKNQKIIVRPPVESLAIVADPLQLQRAVVALLDNSIKYSGENKTIEMKTYASGKSVYIVVSDSGEGISKTELQRVRERFYRGDKARSSVGYGLGLSLVEKVIADHKGKLTINSTLGSGTTVKIGLPLSADRQHKQA